MSFKDYCRRVLNEETDIISLKAKSDAKKEVLNIKAIMSGRIKAVKSINGIKC